MLKILLASHLTNVLKISFDQKSTLEFKIHLQHPESETDVLWLASIPDSGIVAKNVYLFKNSKG